jgi:tail tube protein gp19
MRVSAGCPILVGFYLLASVALPTVGFSQAPTADNQPRLAAPARGAVIQQSGDPAQAPTPVVQPPGQPTTEPAAQPVTQVVGPPAGVTQLPNSTSAATSSSSQAATASYRSYAGSKFALSLDGIQAGPVNGVEGGTPTAEVVAERLGPDNITHKHVGALKYENLSFTTGLDSKPLNDWITATLKGQHVRKNGSVIAADYSGKSVSELEFFNGIITGVTFPALDGASKDAASIAVSLAPEYTRAKASSATSGGFTPKSLKKWTPANFRFEMTGLDGTRVNHIDAITIGQQVTENAVGESRDYEKTASSLEIPNVKLTMSEANAGTWASWLDDFLVKGNNSNDKERDGSIVYLDYTRQTELGRLNLFGCGIVGLAPQKAQAGSEAIRRVQAELYCERMELETKAAGS